MEVFRRRRAGRGFPRGWRIGGVWGVPARVQNATRGRGGVCLLRRKGREGAAKMLMGRGTGGVAWSVR